jgi:Trypsin-like peptidase domain
VPPNFGTAVAISDHFLLTAAHCLYWEHDIRPSASDDEASCWFAFYPDHTNNSIRICHQLDDDVDRLDMFYEPSPDDPIVTVFQYADGHDSSKIYFVDDPTFGADTVLDLALLYSPTPLGHSRYPVAGRSNPLDRPYSPSTVSLLAYHAETGIDVYRDYPNTDRRLLDAALDKIQPDRLTLTSAVTGVRDVLGVIYHRCSSAAGASGGPLLNAQGEMIGIIGGSFITNCRSSC